MTSFRFHLRPCSKEGQHPALLFIRVIHKRRYKDLRRMYPIYPNEWDAKTHTLCLSRAEPHRRNYLKELQIQMQKDLSLLEDIIRALAVTPNCTIREITQRFYEAQHGDTLLGFCRKLAAELTAAGRIRTARAYRSAVRSFLNFHQGEDITIAGFQPQLLRRYEHYLLEKGLQMNTISFYMRNLRAIYYKAISAKIIPMQEVNPFAKVFTGVYQTRRRALDKSEMNALVQLEQRFAREINQLRLGRSDILSPGNQQLMKVQKQREALLYFLFAYHGRGMSFIDLAYLKKSEVNHQTLRYKRKKTGGYLEICITRPMRKIMNYFKSQTQGSIYVFPILHYIRIDPNTSYHTALTHQNKRLKQLAALAGIKKNLSTHVARHTWATLAKRMGYSVALISEGLGHRDTNVTSIYLASFERSAMDELSNKLSAAVRTASKLTIRKEIDIFAAQ